MNPDNNILWEYQHSVNLLDYNYPDEWDEQEPEPEQYWFDECLLPLAYIDFGEF